MYRKILLGVTGSIAAYKSAELIRCLQREGSEVRVVMTRGAQAFITPLTLQSLSGHRVYSEHLDPATEGAMDHISLAKWADAIVIAPASANFLARLAHGLADDLLATLCLATSAPLHAAPAMNQQMWRNAATQANLRLLQERGVRLLGPASGEQACGDVGPGRMLEPEQLCRLLLHPVDTRPLTGLRVMITAGPTREALDPVRFLTNRSSGKMGYHLAEAYRDAGAEVTLVSGPVALAPPLGVKVIAVETAQQMLDAVLAAVDDQQVFIATAAVADFRPAQAANHKIKKGGMATLKLTLEPTPDILATVAARQPRPFCVGFAAETQDLETYALAKLAGKNLDLVVGNLVGGDTGGFETDENSVTVFWPQGQTLLPLASKAQIARELVTLIQQRRQESLNAGSTRP